ncbi:S8 family serine peptidase [Leisingera sp. M527]|uniref:S8 family serine peptidase n=1 Tax=Leisingera sp. M527 TaxID=2867014 RepID=UPI0021A39469|nr:S8 family serine peptidase [Leisingera sp. M527]UWQ32464.1 S8 family serine peptidase [Leisingera sp. M527]
MDFKYSANGEGVELKVSTEFVAVRFKEPAHYSNRLAGVSTPEFGNFDKRFEIPKEKFTIFPVARSPIAPDVRVKAALDSVRQQSVVERASPVFVFGENFGVATDRLLVGLKSGTNASRFFKSYDLDIEATDKNEYVVTMDPGKDPFEVIAALDSQSEVDYVEPDFVIFGKHTVKPQQRESSVTDPLANKQYAIDITEARDAWKLAVGDPAIKIAILDEGVDTAHEDLAAAIVGSYDGSDDDSYQEPNPWDAHGTSCAGLAAAIHGNGKGVLGIGGGCSILAVRIAYSPQQGADWVTRNSWIMRAIDWSWKNGADVLSNSWGGGAPSSAITNAFERARTQGRNGKGCVIAIAAGNANALHDYPSNLDNVLSISASNEYDEPKTPTSQDGEHWWGSNWGPKIDVAAPGVHNYTTDNSGSGGYNTSPAPHGNYYDSFNGTSSSTPIVAGAVGLVLSVNPDLKEDEVRQIIRSTADKVGPLPYVNGRNDRMGYGRLNVLRAVKAALGQQDVVVPVGLHAPVTNADPDSESEVEVLVTHPASTGSVKTARARTRGALESVSGGSLDASSLVRSAPNTEGLRNIAEASYGSPEFEPTTVHGADDRIQITQTHNYPWRAHASLLITARDGSRWIGTAWFIGPHTLVTAGHVVYITNSPVPERNGWVRHIDVMPGRNGTDLPYDIVKSEIFHSVVGWADNGDPQYDYGAITIPTNLGEQVGTIGFGVLSNAEILAAHGNLSGYPGDKSAGTQWYHHNRIASVSTRKVYYDIDTAGGQSGSAVYRIHDGERTAFGIHAYGGATTNSATRITTPVHQNFIHWLST